MTTPTPLRVVLDVDTGTDDAFAIVLAATDPRIEVVAATATWGNCGVTQATRNTLCVLEAAGAPAPVFVGAGAATGPTPAELSAAVMMGRDGLGGVAVPEPARQPGSEDGAAALVRLARAAPGELTFLCTAPLSTLAAALAIEPELPSLVRDLTVMGGAVSCGGNLTAAAEANFANDPLAATQVIDAFGRPGALASGRPPRLVPLDVTLGALVQTRERAALAASALPGAGLLDQVLTAVWDVGVLETGGDGLALHDLLAAWTLLHPEVCGWEVLPVAVDVAGGAAWGASVVDRRVRLIAAAGFDPDTQRSFEQMLGVADARWSIATSVDADAFRAGVRAWLSGQPADP